MKKLISGLMLGTSLLFIGCSKKVTVISTPQGVVRAEKNGNQVTIQSKEGTVTYGANVSAKDLGVPLYPGATQKGGAGFSASSSSDHGSFSMVSLVTKDPVDKVLSYYKAQLPKDVKVTTMNMQGTQMAMLDVEGKNGAKNLQITITSDPKNGQTSIVIMSGAKQK